MESSIGRLSKKYGFSEDLQLELSELLKKYKSLNDTGKSVFLSQAKDKFSKFIAEKLASQRSLGLGFCKSTRT